MSRISLKGSTLFCPELLTNTGVNPIFLISSKKSFNRLFGSFAVIGTIVLSRSKMSTLTPAFYYLLLRTGGSLFKIHKMTFFIFYLSVSSHISSSMI